MQYAVNGLVVNNTYNVQPWVKQGTTFSAGGGFTTTAGIPSQQLLASTNTLLGYGNGQMLAYAKGDGTGAYANLTEGALVNFDPASSDTGQKVWNGFIICDAGLHVNLPINTTLNGSLQVATPKQGWVIRQQFLYAGGTPATDVSVVATAVTGFAGGCSQFQISNQSGSNEVVFAY